jgi:Domain of unknown function (DUF4850)
VKPRVAVVVGVVALIGVGAGAYALGHASGNGAVASSTTSHAAPTMVRVEACASTYGVTYGADGTPIPSATVPAAIAVSLSAPVASELELYTDQYRSLEPILAPKGWKCTVSVGADGSTIIAVFPPGQDSSTATELVSAYSPSACQGCVADLVCPFFVDANLQLGYSSQGCPTTPVPEATFLDGTSTASAGTVKFVEPSHTVPLGNGAGSTASPYTTQGILRYADRSLGGGEGVVDTCTLPPSQSRDCTAILSFFLRSNWDFASAPTTSTSTTSPPPIDTTTTTVPGIGSTVDLSDSSGDGLRVTLQQIVNPDQADASRLYCSTNSAAVIALVISFTNDGSTILHTSSPGNGLTLVNSLGTPLPSSSCDSGTYTASNDATSACGGSTNAMNLAPGDSALWCPIIDVPTGAVLAEIQLDASRAFSGAFLNGAANVALWRP